MKRQKHWNTAARFAALALILLWATPAWANVMIPPIVVVWPAAWVILVPVILVEAAVAVPMLRTGYGKGLRISGIANLVSTAFGIPIGTLMNPFLYDPLLGQTRQKGLLPLVLVFPVFLLSVFIEAYVGKRLVEKAMRRRVWGWSLVANGLTYAATLAFLWSRRT